MCGSASERTRAISWGEMVIEEFTAIRRWRRGRQRRCALQRAARPGERGQQCFQKQNPLLPAQAGTQLLLDSRHKRVYGVHSPSKTGLNALNARYAWE